MNRKILCLTIAALASTPVLALDEASVLQRLEQLEQQRQADQAEIDALKKQVRSLTSSTAPSSLSSSEAQQLQEQIVKVDDKAKRRNASLKRQLKQEKEKLKVNGFMSVYAVRSTVDGVDLGIGVDDSWGFSPDTIVGLQFDYSLADNLDAVIQLTSKGKNDFDTEAEWAFLRYQATDDLTLRGGRLRLPFYMYSESIEVGYAYPWVRPPVEMYSTMITTYEGVDASYQFTLGNWINTAKVYYGSIDLDTVEVDDLAGAEFITENGPWTLRAAYSYFDSLTPTGSPLEGNAKYSVLGARYDDGEWFALLEASDGVLGSSLPVLGTESYTGTLGYQFDKFMPYVVYSKTYSNSEHEKNVEGLPVEQSVDQESYTLGLKYNATPQVVLKGEAVHYDGFDGTLGEIGADLVANPGLRNKLDDDGVTVMSLGFDLVF